MTSQLAALFRHDRTKAATRVCTALRRTRGRIDLAACRLGVSYRTLHRLLKEHGFQDLPSKIRAGVK